MSDRHLGGGSPQPGRERLNDFRSHRRIANKVLLHRVHADPAGPVVLGPLLGPSVKVRPGVRLGGSFDPLLELLSTLAVQEPRAFSKASTNPR